MLSTCSTTPGGCRSASASRWLSERNSARSIRPIISCETSTGGPSDAQPLAVRASLARARLRVALPARKRPAVAILCPLGTCPGKLLIDLCPGQTGHGSLIHFDQFGNLDQLGADSVGDDDCRAQCTPQGARADGGDASSLQDLGHRAGLPDAVRGERRILSSLQPVLRIPHRLPVSDKICPLRHPTSPTNHGDRMPHTLTRLGRLYAGCARGRGTGEGGEDDADRVVVWQT